MCIRDRSSTYSKGLNFSNILKTEKDTEQMDNDLITAGQISDEFTLMSLFFRADLVVKLVILILFAAFITSAIPVLLSSKIC